MAIKPIQVSCGGSSIAYLLSDGTVMTSGTCLGSYGEPSHQVPERLPNLKDVSEVSVGTGSEIFLMNDHSVKIRGSNYRGQLGNGSSVIQATEPIAVPGLNNVKKVFAGLEAAFYLFDGGVVKACGYNEKGQLGLGNNTIKISTPTQIPNLSNVVQISNQFYSTACVMSDGTVKVSGYNHNHELGLNSVGDRNTFTTVPNLTDVIQVASGVSYLVYLLSDGTVKYSGQIHPVGTARVPTLIPDLSDVAQISSGVLQVAFLMKNGTVKMLGGNNCGQLGLGDTAGRALPTQIPGVENVSEVICGTNFTLLRFRDGSIKVFGVNDYYVLGLGDKEKRLVPTDVNLVIPSTTYYMYLKGNEVYNEQNGTLIKACDDYTTLDSTAKKDLFLTSSQSLAAPEKISNLSPVKLLMYSESSLDSCKINGILKKELICRDLILMEDYIGIEKVTITTSLSSGYKVLVTTDKNEYKTFTDGAWKAVDCTDLTSAYTIGMDSNVIENITTEQWSQLLNGQSQIGFAYIFDSESESKNCSVEEVVLVLSAAGVWEMAVPGAGYTYRYPDRNTIQVTLFNAGKYKINYMDVE